MSIEKGPSCVTAIGWVWIYVGGLISCSGVLDLFSFLSECPTSLIITPVQSFLNLTLILGLIKIGLGILSLISGIKFLKLKTWSSSVLQILTWMCIIFFIAFVVFLLISIRIDISLLENPVIIVTIGICSIPVIMMLKCLRGTRVKNAMSGSADPTTGQQSPQRTTSAMTVTGRFRFIGQAMILFVILVACVTLIRYLLFPEIDVIGYGATPKVKFSLGVPKFFTPMDFSGCIIEGPTWYVSNLLVNIALYYPIALLVVWFRRHKGIGLNK